MFENPGRGRQARNFKTNVPKILDPKSSSEQIFQKIDVGCLLACWGLFLDVLNSFYKERYMVIEMCFTASQ